MKINLKDHLLISASVSERPYFKLPRRAEAMLWVQVPPELRGKTVTILASKKPRRKK